MYDSFNPPPGVIGSRSSWRTPDPAMPVIFCAHAPPDPKDLLRQGPWPDLATASNVKVALTGHWHRRHDRAGRGRRPSRSSRTASCEAGQNPGTYYILDALPSGKIAIHEFSVADLNLREPPDALPTVAIVQSPDGQMLHGAVTFRGTAADDKAVQKVEYSVDWGPWQPAKGTKEWQLTLDTAHLPDGNHIFRFRAIDSAGQASLRLAKVIEATENHLAPGRIFRFQQGRDSYNGCSDVTVEAVC